LEVVYDSSGDGDKHRKGEDRRSATTTERKGFFVAMASHSHFLCVQNGVFSTEYQKLQTGTYMTSTSGQIVKKNVPTIWVHSHLMFSTLNVNLGGTQC
jgi:hypothetical protein